MACRCLKTRACMFDDPEYLRQIANLIESLDREAAANLALNYEVHCYDRAVRDHSVCIADSKRLQSLQAAKQLAMSDRTTRVWDYLEWKKTQLVASGHPVPH